MRLLMSITYIAILGILAHYIGESMPRRWFSENRFPFITYKWENGGKAYQKIKIKKWKNKLPDMSRIMKDMLPKRISYGATSEHIDALVKETCVAEFVHVSLIFLSVGIYFILKNYIGVILCLVFIAINVPFILIQRFNRPHLVNLRNKISEREERIPSAVPDTDL